MPFSTASTSGCSSSRRRIRSPLAKVWLRFAGRADTAMTGPKLPNTAVTPSTMRPTLRLLLRTRKIPTASTASTDSDTTASVAAAERAVSRLRAFVLPSMASERRSTSAARGSPAL